MNDFFDALKDIKKDLVKEVAQKAPPKPKKVNPNRDEFKDIFKESEFDIAKESVEARQKRLEDEFLKYTKQANIKKI